MTASESDVQRRQFLIGLAATLAAAPASAAPVPAPALAPDISLATLITQAQALPSLSGRIDFIARALLGRRYQANTLIGGPAKPEQMVTREDRFDCVTFCEAVLAAAASKEPAAYEANLRAIRYHGGVVAWRERNHDFAAWCERNTENGRCVPVELGETTEIDKTVGVPAALGRRSYTILAVSRADLLAQAKQLLAGDIIGFVSRQKTLDYFHTGFIAFGPKDELLLRHASQHHRKVVDEPMSGFCAANRVKYVTLLRPVEPAA